MIQAPTATRSRVVFRRTRGRIQIIERLRSRPYSEQVLVAWMESESPPDLEALLNPNDCDRFRRWSQRLIPQGGPRPEQVALVRLGLDLARAWARSGRLSSLAIGAEVVAAAEAILQASTKRSHHVKPSLDDNEPLVVLDD